MERNTHKFEFSAVAIATAATAEAEYHEARLVHWQQRAHTAIEKVRQQASIKLIEQEVTNGKRYGLHIDHGDPEAWSDYLLAADKVESHRQAAERFRVDERVYGTQGERPYLLDTDDVHFYRLGDQEREA